MALLKEVKEYSDLPERKLDLIGKAISFKYELKGEMVEICFLITEFKHYPKNSYILLCKRVRDDSQDYLDIYIGISHLRVSYVTDRTSVDCKVLSVRLSQ